MAVTRSPIVVVEPWSIVAGAGTTSTLTSALVTGEVEAICAYQTSGWLAWKLLPSRLSDQIVWKAVLLESIWS